MNGYIYRVPFADAATLARLVHDLVGLPCYSCGGAAAWDFDPAAGPDNLRSIEMIAGIEERHLRGDFGHFFTAQAELRWKRRTADRYDVAIFSERELASAPARPLGGPWTVTAPGSAALLQAAGHPPITYLVYCAANGAAQFLRFTGVRP